mgnify:CR=1 FL=1
MKTPFLVTMFILLLKTTIFAQMLDLTIKITKSRQVDQVIRLTDSLPLDEYWNVVGACKNTPNLTVRITSSYQADKIIKIVKGPPTFLQGIPEPFRDFWKYKVGEHFPEHRAGVRVNQSEKRVSRPQAHTH